MVQGASHPASSQQVARVSFRNPRGKRVLVKGIVVFDKYWTNQWNNMDEKSNKEIKKKEHKDSLGSVKIDLRPQVGNSSFFTMMEKNRENNYKET